MKRLFEYSIQDDVKKELGYIIRETRIMNYLDAKEEKIIEKNPYTKENFCENNRICHYHTLTKIENDIVKDDNLYHIFLEKLGYYFQVESDEHEKNMDILFNLREKIIRALEYLDLSTVNDINKEIQVLDFEADCIAKIYFNLLKFTYEVVLGDPNSKKHLEIDQFVDFYKTVYKALAYHSLGIYYLNNHNQKEAINYFINAHKIYEQESASFGLSMYPLLEVYICKENYLDSVELSLKLKSYYLKTNNNNRLVLIYKHLSIYYLKISSLQIAENYYDESIKLFSDNSILSIHMLHYYWGIRYMSNYEYEKSLEYIKEAYRCCKNNRDKLQIINRLLILNTRLKSNEEENEDLMINGENSYDAAPSLEQNIFKYFIYKLENKRYFRRYAIEKVIPQLKDNVKKEFLLLFFYEDLYDK